VSRRELSYWSTAAQRWVLAGGDRKVDVGASSRDIRLHGRGRVEGEHDHDGEHDTKPPNRLP
jgi:beta-glucosidase